MASPGSNPAAGTPPPMMQKGTMIGLLAVFVILIVVMQFRMQIGEILNIVFQVIDFNGEWPVFTLIIAGLIMITLSTVIRSFLTDPIAQARNQQMQSDFNKELRQARLENNLFKMKKLQDQQPAMMAKSMESSTQMMKIMPVTMIVVIPIYAWVWYFLQETVPDPLTVINLPWGSVDIMGTMLMFLPIWIVVYTLISMPIGQLENRIMRFIFLRKRLDELS